MSTTTDNQETYNAYINAVTIREARYPRIKACQVLGFGQSFLAFLQSDIESDEWFGIGISIAWIVGLGFRAPIFAQLQTYMDLLRETSNGSFILLWSVILFIQLLAIITGSLLWRRSGTGLMAFMFIITAWILTSDLGVSMLGGYSIAAAVQYVFAVAKLNFKIRSQDITRD